MKGTRPLTDEEIETLKEYFDARESDADESGDDRVLRDRTLIFLSLYIGTRISETLSICVGDVWQYGKISGQVYLKKENMKGKKQGRSCVLNDKCRELLKTYIDHYHLSNISPKSRLFLSKKGNLGKRQATRIFKTAFEACELTGKLATHTTRKTFARKIYDKVDGNIVDLQVAMGHSEISSTVHYISENNKKITQAVSSLEF